VLHSSVLLMRRQYRKGNPAKIRDCPAAVSRSKSSSIALVFSEVDDLEKAGIKVIQIDEPAIREGLPLRREDWDEYFNWAVEAFLLASSGVRDETQIHTHMIPFLPWMPTSFRWKPHFLAWNCWTHLPECNRSANIWPAGWRFWQMERLPGAASC
jgi:hypothetical protein